MTRDLVLVAFSLFTWGVGEGMFIYFQSLYLERWGADPVRIGIILGAMGISMAVAQAPAGYLADRVGTRPVMWASWILGSIAAGVMALAPSLAVFVTGMLLYGLTSFVIAPMNSYITSVRGKWSVQRALTSVSAMFNLGAVIGPLAGGLLAERFDLATVYRISTVIFVLSTAIILMARRPPVEDHQESHQALKPNLLKNTRFAGLLVIIFITMFALYLPQPLTPNFLQNQHSLSLAAIGQLGAVNSLGNALLQLLLGGLKAPIGFLTGQVLVGLFALAIWQGTGMLWFSAGYFFLGGYRLARMMALAYARTLVKVSETGLAYGLVETSNATAVIAAPLAAGFLYQTAPHAVYIASLAALTIVLTVNFFTIRSQSASQPSFAASSPAADQALPE